MGVMCLANDNQGVLPSTTVDVAFSRANPCWFLLKNGPVRYEDNRTQTFANSRDVHRGVVGAVSASPRSWRELRLFLRLGGTTATRGTHRRDPPTSFFVHPCPISYAVISSCTGWASKEHARMSTGPALKRSAGISPTAHDRPLQMALS